MIKHIYNESENLIDKYDVAFGDSDCGISMLISNVAKSRLYIIHFSVAQPF